VAGDLANNDWVVLLAAAALLFNAVRGVLKGRAILFYRTVDRHEDGFLYWTAVLGSAVLGVAAVLAVLVA
jgi:hypothetical protein